MRFFNSAPKCLSRPARVDHALNQKPGLVTRRSALALAGSGLGLGLAVGFGLAPAVAQQDRYLDVRRSGEFQPIPIAVTAFAGEPAASAQLTGIITNNFKRSVFLAPIDPKTFVETDRQSGPGAALRVMARDQCAIHRHRPRRAQFRRAAAGRIPALGRRLRRAGRGPAICHRRRTIRAASRISSPTRFFRGSPASRAFSTPESSSSTRPARRKIAASASRSWTRTAPMCAI